MRFKKGVKDELGTSFELTSMAGSKRSAGWHDIK